MGSSVRLLVTPVVIYLPDFLEPKLTLIEYIDSAALQQWSICPATLGVLSRSAEE